MLHIWSFLRKQESSFLVVVFCIPTCAESLLCALKGNDSIALDGKTVRGSLKQGCDISHFLSVLGNAPQVMAALRNTAIGLIRGAGKTNIAAACREFATKPAIALGLIGITM